MPHFEDLFVAGGITFLLITITRLNSIGDAIGSLFGGKQPGENNEAQS